MGRILHLLPLLRAATPALIASLLAAAWPLAAAAQDSLVVLRKDFQHQADPVGRAKKFPKLGGALLAEMRKDLQAKDFDRVPPLLAEYRDGASAAFNSLEAAGRDADKHPGGYRELEMHLRRSLHVVNDIVFALPLEQRDGPQAAQRDLERLDEKLVKALFPTKPEGAKTPPSSSPPHPQG